MKVIILGAGAIGSLYGAKLSKIYDVILVGRKQHVDLINKNGLKVTGQENKTYKLKAVTEIDKIEENTLILLATKVQDSKDAIGPIKDLIKKDTAILCMQNGLYSENIVKDIVRDKCLVLRGITNVGAMYLEPGTVQFNNLSYTAIEDNKISKDLVDNFNKCGLNAFVSKNIKKDIWKKLIFNCVLNPITAILRVKSRLIVDERLNPLKRLIVDECLKVAEKDKVKFDIDFVELINQNLESSKNISSMYQDIIKGKKTEINYLNGAVIELGRKYGVRCPVNEGLVMIINEMEKSNKENNKEYKQH